MLVIIFSLIMTLLQGIIAVGTLVFSTYLSDKNYKLGKVFWRLSIITNVLYSISFWLTVVIVVYKCLDLIF